MSHAILLAEAERLAAKAAIYGHDTLWQQNEFCEILPAPTPLSLSLLRLLASQTGATGRVCRDLGIHYSNSVPMEDYLETIFGRTFVNRAAEKLLIGGDKPKNRLRQLIASAKTQAAAKTFYLNFTKNVKELDSCYNAHCTTSLERASAEELLSHIGTLVEELNQHYRHVVKAGLFARLSLDELQTSAGGESLPELLQTDNREILSTDRTAMEILTYREERLAALAHFSAEVEYELACPRYWETPATLSNPSATSKKSLLAAPLPSQTRQALFHFKIYESLKVIYKTLLLRELSLLRSALLAYARKCSLEGGVFYLQLDELFSGEITEHRGAIQKRQQAERLFLPVEVPSTLKPVDLPGLITGSSPCADHNLKGLSVNGIAFAGDALIYRNRQDLDRLAPGQIVVAKHASSDLVSLFSKTSGIITETGGLLSHLAIVAREHGFPVLLQVSHATSVIKDGDQLVISRDGRVTRD